MSTGGIPESVRSFVLTNLHSVEQVEVLLHLRKYQDKEWTAESVSLSLKTNTSSISKRLADLHSRGLLSYRNEGGECFYQFFPSRDLKTSVDGLAQYYASHSARIIELIYSRPAESIRWFADAFRLRKGDEV